MQLQQSLGNYLPSVLGAIAIFVVGLVVALLVRAGVRKAIVATGIEAKVHDQTEGSLPLARIGSLVAFWLVIVLTLAGVFSVLRFEALYSPFSALASEVMLYLPRILLAAVLAGFAWVLAVLLRAGLNRLMAATQWDEKLSSSAGVKPIASTLGNVVYWLVLLLFLPAIIAALNIQGLMAPLSDMTHTFLQALPNVFSAALIAGAGWLLARVLRGLVTHLLDAAGADKLGSEVDSGLKLSKLGGTLVFVLVMVPALIAALDTLGITALSAPAIRMLEIFLAAIPHVLAAAAILIVAWYLGRFVAGLIARLLQSLGFDQLPARLGLGQAFDAPKPGDDAPGGNSLSTFAGKLALFFVMLFATVEAAHQLGFAGVRELFEQFIAFGADILLGGVILAVGYWLADVAAKAIQRANPDKAIGLSRIARIAILGMVLAMGLRAMGIADDIVNLAFGLILGAVAVATALAFGLGGREAAATLTQRWARDYLQHKDRQD
ncbi:mechanosensitive ion channel [Pseudoxanthomonas kalamensis]|uniref:mechanosensitive ion channel n=1 Tax=Pseudoxanthomonas kalamensis TaxID=289483 RepID=UPI001B87B060|nr:mechanosensitive ion channel [Pseudoxanthomonas kalamensis]